MQAKIDNFYISSVAPKCLTELEFARYIRERDRAEIAHVEATKAAEKNRLEAVLHSTRVAGDEASVERELAAADKARGLDEDDVDSDIETEILSIVEHPKAADSDPSNKRARRFFFSFIEVEVIGSPWCSNWHQLSNPAMGRAIKGCQQP